MLAALAAAHALQVCCAARCSMRCGLYSLACPVAARILSLSDLVARRTGQRQPSLTSETTLGEQCSLGERYEHLGRLRRPAAAQLSMLHSCASPACCSTRPAAVLTVEGAAGMRSPSCCCQRTPCLGWPLTARRTRRMSGCRQTLACSRSPWCAPGHCWPRLAVLLRVLPGGLPPTLLLRCCAGQHPVLR